MDPSLLAAIGGVITSIGAIIVGVLTTRKNNHLDDLALAIRQRDEARENEERANERVVEVVAQLTKQDRLVLILRQYIARLSRLLIDRNIEVPVRPPEMDE
ncbi:hypothetical protein CH296_00335 [Rhodococcus sp. 14-2496-1d]|uniref:hypothetical protein n=1 Tax=Rhodococcus sp. 14-2496-1d TaxID=2023146 RepID=UPI000B9B52FB|nr:hypothetical protein [Rhodococcus sp. 14-2496-1d]OZF40739.1 hypothetical protein CH296_00335 [Rhodococcus sp. 14-2496-1d]